MAKYNAEIKTSKSPEEIDNILTNFLTGRGFSRMKSKKTNQWRKGAIWTQFVRYQASQGHVLIEAWMNLPIPGFGSFIVYFTAKDRLNKMLGEIKSIIEGSSAVELSAEPVIPELEYAGFWRRACAIIIDLTIIIIVISLFSAAVIPSNNRTRAMLLQAVIIIGAWLYFSVFESSARQATPGKMLLGIKVTDVNKNRISFGKASGRFFSKIISAAILYIGFILAAFTERKQALHDIMTGSLVVTK